ARPRCGPAISISAIVVTTTTAHEAPIVIGNRARALVNIVERCLRPLAISLLTLSIQSVAIGADIPASLSIVAGRDASLPAAAVIATLVVFVIVAVATAIAVTATTARQVSVNVHNSAALVNVVQRGAAPVAIFLLAFSFQSVAVGADVAAGLYVISRWQAALPVVVSAAVIAVVVATAVAAKRAVIADDLAVAILHIGETRGTPFTVSVLAARSQRRPINQIYVRTGLLI